MCRYEVEEESKSSRESKNQEVNMTKSVSSALYESTERRKYND